MATYIKIASNTVGAGGAASVTFSSIPATYTDLVIKYSARASSAGSNYENIQIEFNGVGGTAYSDRALYGTGSSALSAANSSLSATYLQYSVGGNATANTFSNGELYFPNYRSSNAKSYSADTVSENNATASIAALNAGISTNTAAITSIKLTGNSSNFVQYSTFTLYGISNA